MKLKEAKPGDIVGIVGDGTPLRLESFDGEKGMGRAVVVHGKMAVQIGWGQAWVEEVELSGDVHVHRQEGD